ncbi:MAG: HAD-IA family hydrolase [Tenuifilaceae bacterium]|nr:HAD-IA family hydrolase [Tenuifilaceae bacterium]
MLKPNLIFDFDGTIANTLNAGVDIYNRVAHEYGCKKFHHKDTEEFQGKKPFDLMRELEVSLLNLPLLLLRIRHELFSEIKNVEPFDGITEMLHTLKQSGYNLGVVTSNSKKNVEHFFEEHNLNNIFSSIHTSKHLFGKHKVIAKYMRQHDITKETAVYIGDEARDIEATQKIGIPIIAVSWGFNTKNILEMYKPFAIVDSPKELLSTILSM